MRINFQDYFSFYSIFLNAAMSKLNSRHTITIDVRTYQKLKSKGNFGETYSKLIDRILKDSETYHELVEKER
jgi:hypothetical protein